LLCGLHVEIYNHKTCSYACACVRARTPIHVRSGSRTFLGVTCPGYKGFFLLCVFIDCDWNLRPIQEPVFQLQPPNGIENIIFGKLTHLVLYDPLCIVECIIQHYLTVNTLRMETTLPTRQRHILEFLNPYTYIEINLSFLTTYFAPSVLQWVLLNVKLNKTLVYICY
jgi:hypothetical protein